MREIFRNRIEAGKLLAEKLLCYANQPNVIVLGLPRGGVPVAFEVAKALRVPLDVFVVRKLGTPADANWRWVQLPPEVSACSMKKL